MEAVVVEETLAEVVEMQTTGAVTAVTAAITVEVVAVEGAQGEAQVKTPQAATEPMASSASPTLPPHLAQPLVLQLGLISFKGNSPLPAANLQSNDMYWTPLTCTYETCALPMCFYYGV